MMIRDPSPGAAALAAVRRGAVLNPADADLGAARTVILAVKPQAFAPIVAALEPWLAADAVVLSVMAGLGAQAIGEALPGREIGRAMPTTAAAVGKGAASVWAAGPRARACAHALFEPLGVVVDLETEAQIHAATAGVGLRARLCLRARRGSRRRRPQAGLSAPAARDLARSALFGAAALLEATGEDAQVLRRQVTSPGGTTEAALGVLMGDDALAELVGRAVEAAARRSRELGGEA